MDTPGPTFWPFLRMSGSSAPNSPMDSDTFSPATPLPLRCPETPNILTMFLVATGSKSSAPACLSSTFRRSAAISNLSTPMTLPCATISSVRSSPGILLKNIDLPLIGWAVPKASVKRSSSIPMLSPMHGRISPGLLISNSLPSEPHLEHLLPSNRVPQRSHHLRTSFPLAMFVLAGTISTD